MIVKERWTIDQSPGQRVCNRIAYFIASFLPFTVMFVAYGAIGSIYRSQGVYLIRTLLDLLILLPGAALLTTFELTNSGWLMLHPITKLIHKVGLRRSIRREQVI